jgi:peroxiredoxin
MPNLFKENLLLLTILGSGLLFAIAAVAVVGLLLLQSPPVADPMVIAAATASVEMLSVSQNTEAIPDPTSLPTTIPTTADTPEPAATSTPTKAAAAGDRLTLPTAMPTPLPSPTTTPTPTITPVPQKVEGLRVGNIAPDFTLGSNRASRVSLSELRGKIVILNFWASWCPPCRHEVPALQTIHNEFGPRGVVVLAVNEREKLSDVERFAHDNSINFAVWLDEDGWAGNIYQARSIPTTYFIDEEGIIQAIQIGSMTREQIVTHLEKLL